MKQNSSLKYKLTNKLANDDLEVAVDLYYASLNEPRKSPRSQSANVIQNYTPPRPTRSTSLGLFGSDSDSDIHIVTNDRKSKLAELFRPPMEIVFRGTFQYAKDHAKVEKKWLLIDLHDRTQFACQVLNRDIWKIKAVQDLVVANFLFLQLYTETSDGQNYKNFYPVTNYPHVSILDPRTGERVAIIPEQSLKNPECFVETLIEFLSVYDLDETRLEDEFDLILPMSSSEPSSGPRIQIRLPSGQSLVRRFLRTDKVRDIYSFVKNHVKERFHLSYMGQNLDLDQSTELLANASITVIN